MENNIVTKIYLASDHAGFEAKKKIKNIVKKLGYEFEDLGPFDDKSVDYPEFAKKVSEKVVVDKNSFGILICGSGIGMQIAANKFKGIRAAFCYDLYSAKMARYDNNANVLTLRARKFPSFKYKKIIETFLKTEFSGEERHKRRIEQISNLEKWKKAKYL